MSSSTIGLSPELIEVVLNSVAEMKDAVLTAYNDSD
jgi:hypothetical protein